MIVNGEHTPVEIGLNLINLLRRNMNIITYKIKPGGIQMSSPDIRAGVALLIAALSAEGTSIIQNIDQIDRGYQYIDKRLQALGAQIKRI